MNTSLLPLTRRRFARRLLPALLAALPGAAKAAPQHATPGSPPAPATKLGDDAFDEAVGTIGSEAVGPEVSALLVAVDVGGERLLVRGFAALPGSAPDGDTPFHAGPLFSSFLSVAALQLAEQGRLDLEASLAEHFPELPYGGLGVRVDDLLTHTSGIPGYGDLLSSSRRRSPEDDWPRILAWLGKGPLESAPRSCASYSNTNDLLLGLLLERVTGRSVQEHLAEALFAPAGMEDTAFATAARPLAGARVEQHFAGEREDQAGAPAPFGAERLLSTAHDLLRFQRALVEGRLMPASAVELRATPLLLADGSSGGAGRGISLTELGGHACLSAGGGMAGQRVQLAHYPDLDATIVVWAGGENAPAQQLAARVARALLEVQAPEVHDHATSAELRQRHEGDYYVACTSYVILDEEEHLVLYPPNGPRMLLLYQGGETFVARDDPDLRLVFESEGARTVAFTMNDHGVALRARRLF